MMRLNRYAAEAMLGFAVLPAGRHRLRTPGARAGDAGEQVSIEIYPKSLPYFDEAYHYAEEFMLTAAGQRNRTI
jgi:selenide,water dikinase